MYFTSGSDRAFEQLMQTRPGADHFDSGEAGAPEDCGTCRFYRPHWKYQFCVYEECPYQPGKRTALDGAVKFQVKDAEECVNDAYLGAWNAIPPARPNPLLSYLVKIVRNISLKIYWRKEAAKRSSHYTIALEEIEACIAAPNTVEAEIEAKELARIIEAFLDTLTTENRVIFMRRYWFSDSYEDIAEFMGLSEKNISVRLTRIREKMKQYLIEREVFV